MHNISRYITCFVFLGCSDYATGAKIIIDHNQRQILLQAHCTHHNRRETLLQTVAKCSPTHYRIVGTSQLELGFVTDTLQKAGRGITEIVSTSQSAGCFITGSLQFAGRVITVHYNLRNILLQTITICWPSDYSTLQSEADFITDHYNLLAK